MPNSRIKFENRLFRKKEISIIRNQARRFESDNSEMVSAPIVDLLSIFPDSNTANCTSSLVTINGPSDEPPHFHLSHVLGIVVSGTGVVRDGESRRKKVIDGDLVVIPKGVLHYFETAQGEELKWIALEFNDGEIDYQKHFTVD